MVAAQNLEVEIAAPALSLAVRARAPSRRGLSTGFSMARTPAKDEEAAQPAHVRRPDFAPYANRLFVPTPEEWKHLRYRRRGEVAINIWVRDGVKLTPAKPSRVGGWPWWTRDTNWQYQWGLKSTIAGVAVAGHMLGEGVERLAQSRHDDAWRLEWRTEAWGKPRRLSAKGVRAGKSPRVACAKMPLPSHAENEAARKLAAKSRELVNGSPVPRNLYGDSVIRAELTAEAIAEYYAPRNPSRVDVSGIEDDDLRRAYEP